MKNNYIDIKRSESSPTEPVTLAQLKAQLYITFTDDDTLLTSLITQARKAIENYCNISIVTQTIILTADLYNEWELPYGPVTGITSVKTRSANEGSGPQTYTTTTSGWGYDGDEFITFIPADFGQFNPSIPYRGLPDYPYPNRYRIQYNTGMATVPDDLKLAILQEAAYRFENRGDALADKGVCEPARILANPYVRQIWQ